MDRGMHVRHVDWDGKIYTNDVIVMVMMVYAFITSILETQPTVFDQSGKQLITCSTKRLEIVYD